mmetsp:Transcript_7085/g.12267  ORF Transcript_7085/g.12267 Transcript_7085/m.12267 type:complete len:138 (-) Transcript_7085:122-535(-)|eukprot:CAMPEP_0198231732 /NCGR_PEP_ID=MMETSP1445-20131203/115355_1 /TAXON_ID=36898 /ORGANISM="Pyramimonas sp., Strain CCMP2087" /LENGTH=137 /DNA_ID=CAMNT_0043912363 /DNA_START=144 /DNA_END=557 /DNA_ORIENTATION=+
MPESYEELLGELFASGVLDCQFSQLQLLEDESNPDFVEEMVELYFEDTVTKLEKLGEMMTAEKMDVQELDSTFHQLKGSSASIGACGMAISCANCKAQFQLNDPELSEKAYEAVLDSFTTLKTRLQALMKVKHGDSQ